MTAAQTDTPLSPPNGPATLPPKPKRRQSPATQVTPDMALPKRRLVRRDNANRAYYICQRSATGEPTRMIVRMPTIGQARKALDLTRRAAGLESSQVCIVRTVIVE